MLYENQGYRMVEPNSVNDVMYEPILSEIIFSMLLVDTSSDPL